MTKMNKLLALRPRYIISPGGRIVSGKSVIFSREGIIDIVEHGKEREYGVEEIITREHHLLMPGFIDAHTHTQQILLRGAISDQLLQLPPIWTELLIPFEKKLDYKLAYLSSILSIANMIDAGTVYFVEAGAPHPEALINALKDAGMSGAVSPSTYDILPGDERDPDEVLKLYNRLWNMRDTGIDIWYSVREVMMCSPRLIKLLVEEARRKKTGLTYHIAEYQGEVDYTLSKYMLRPLEYMDKLGATDIKPLIAAHGVYLSRDEILLANEKSVGIAWCPTVDSLLMGKHWGPEHLLSVKNLLIGLGSDGGAFTRLDLLTEVKTARSIAKSFGVMSRYDKTIMNTLESYKMITGFEGRIIGKDFSIKPGSKAYFITIDLYGLGLIPGHEVLDTVISFASPVDIVDVVVNGRFLKKERRLVTIDTRKLVEELASHFPYIKEVVVELLQEIRKRRNQLIQ